MIVRLHFQYKTSLTNRKKLKQFLKEIFINESTPASSLDIIFCDDKFLLDINRRFLNHDYYTDIISFNLNKDLYPVEGEIYLSIDRIKENALVFNSSTAFELHRVIIHGVLHLCGFNDTSKEEQLFMREKEDLYLHQYLVSRGTK